MRTIQLIKGLYINLILVEQIHMIFIRLIACICVHTYILNRFVNHFFYSSSIVNNTEWKKEQ